MARLAVLVPKPRVNLTRFHGVFAPNSKHRALITPAKRGQGNKRQENRKTDDGIPEKRHAAMTLTFPLLGSHSKRVKGGPRSRNSQGFA